LSADELDTLARQAVKLEKTAKDAIYSIALRSYKDDKLQLYAARILKCLSEISDEFGRDQQFDSSTRDFNEMRLGRIENVMGNISRSFAVKSL
jgi:hypothetical protein